MFPDCWVGIEISAISVGGMIIDSLRNLITDFPIPNVIVYPLAGEGKLINIHRV